MSHCSEYTTTKAYQQGGAECAASPSWPTGLLHCCVASRAPPSEGRCDGDLRASVPPERRGRTSALTSAPLAADGARLAPWLRGWGPGLGLA